MQISHKNIQLQLTKHMHKSYVIQGVFFYKVTILKLNNFGCGPWILMIFTPKCSSVISILCWKLIWGERLNMLSVVPMAQNVYFWAFFGFFFVILPFCGLITQAVIDGFC